MGELNKNNEDFYLFCQGIGCLLRESCHRYRDGEKIDKSAPGYNWMVSCDEDERNGYSPMQVK